MTDKEFKEDKQVEIPVSLNPVLVDIRKTFLVSNTLKEQQSLEELLGKDTQVIRILAAGTKECIKDGILTWQSPGFEETDNNGLSSGGVYRVGAGAIAMKIFSEAKGIVGSRYVDDRQPPPSIVMKEELKMLGLDEKRILSDPQSIDTIAELVRLFEMCVENNWNSGVCITNEYHCERVQALLYNLSWLSFNKEKTEKFLQGIQRIKDGQLKIRVIPAEEIIKRYDEEIYKLHISNYLSSNVLEQRKENEKKGVNLITGGQYSRYNAESNQREILRRSDDPSLTLI